MAGMREKTPKTMQGTIPNVSKQTADTELHSMKRTCTIARYSVETDAMPAKNIAAPMNTQYRLSNVTPERIVPDRYLIQVRRQMP